MNAAVHARCSDQRLVILQAASAAEAHTMVRQEPSLQARVFASGLHEFNVFHAGTVQARRRRS
jgi:hypothetical protein